MEIQYKSGQGKSRRNFCGHSFQNSRAGSLHVYEPVNIYSPIGCASPRSDPDELIAPPRFSADVWLGGNLFPSQPF
jgi:hypothetical protein